MNVREAWPDEAQDFTPWLAEHLDLLGDTIGVNIDLEEIEAQVGGFSLDILATSERGLVAIENQLEQGNHNHLGQLITYAAGLEAKVLVWISTGFRQEHLDAVEWLNTLGTTAVGVFAVQVRVVRIDESRMAPDFRALMSPKGWSLKAGSRGDANGMSNDERNRRIEWFDNLARRALERKLTDSTGFSSVAKSKSFPCRVGEPGLKYWVDLRTTGVACVQLEIRTGDIERNESIVNALDKDKGAIEQELDFEPEFFHPDPDGPRGRIKAAVMRFREASIDDPSDQLVETLEWCLKVLAGFQRVLEPRLRAIIDELDSEEPKGVEGTLLGDGIN